MVRMARRLRGGDERDVAMDRAKAINEVVDLRLQPSPPSSHANRECKRQGLILFTRCMLVARGIRHGGVMIRELPCETSNLDNC